MSDDLEPAGEADFVLIRLGEIWLKGRNRRAFLRQLRQNIAGGLRIAAPGSQLQEAHARLFVRLAGPEQVEPALAALADTPGITSVSLARRVAPHYPAIVAAAEALVDASWSGLGGSFAVRTRRRDKRFPMRSGDVSREVGASIVARTGLGVNLTRPDRTLGIEIEAHRAHVWVRTEAGLGGLPVGCAGRVLLLLSGGIDSPVAGYMAQKRGCELDAVYFHSPPYISEGAREKVLTLARRLAVRQHRLRLHVVRFTEIQTAIHAECEPRHTVLLYRRFMYRIAHQIAARTGALALATGECLGQVASQTLENLSLVDGLAPRLTLRPLLCFDKQEVIDLARRIGTYDTSILPFDDCCTLFVPKNPTIRGRLADLEAQEARLDVSGLIAAALDRTELVE